MLVWLNSKSRTCFFLLFFPRWCNFNFFQIKKFWSRSGTSLWYGRNLFLKGNKFAGCLLFRKSGKRRGFRISSLTFFMLRFWQPKIFPMEFYIWRGWSRNHLSSVMDKLKWKVYFQLTKPFSHQKRVPCMSHELGICLF